MGVDVENLSDPAAKPENLLVGMFDEGDSYVIRRVTGASSWLLTWTVAGGGRLRQGETEVQARPGDLVVLGPSVAQHYGTDPYQGRWQFWWAHFQPRTPWVSWLHPYERPGRVYHIPVDVEAVSRRVGAVFRQLHADARWSGEAGLPEPAEVGARTARTVAASAPAARELALGGLETILVLTAVARADGGGGLDGRVRRAQALIDADPTADHTVAGLAARVALSPSRFAHLFAEQTGRGPMEAVRQARLGLAARLLEATELDVSQVAAASGFASPFHFSRRFHRYAGLSPRAYRDRLRQGSG